MTAFQAVNFVESICAAALIWLIVVRLFATSRLDEFRQAMFTVRDELFDYAASGKICFSHPAYGLLRILMNAYIQYAHRLTFFQICMTLLQWQVAEPKPDLYWAARWEAALASLESEEVRCDLKKFYGRTEAIVMKRLVTGSPLLFGFGLIITGRILVRNRWHGLRRAARSGATSAINGIVDHKLLEEDAVRTAA